MAIGQNVAWEIRSTATAGNVNGGGFDNSLGGTDYSQQDASQYNGTDLASSNGTTNPSVVTSATHTFVAADVGNLINITAGTNWTTGRYKIVSVSAGAATLDRAVGGAASLTAGTYRVGGALSLGNANDQTTLTAVAGGNTIYIKSGAYTLGVAITAGFGQAGVSFINTVMTGYTSTRGDSCTGTNRPKITTTTGLQTLSNNFTYNNISFVLPGGNGFSGGTNALFYNCKMYNNGGGLCISGANNNFFASCEIVSTKSIGLNAMSGLQLVGCYVHNCITGVNNSSNIQIVNTLFENNITQAIILAAASHLISGCTIYGAENKLGIGINNATNLGVNCINSIFYGLASGITTNTAGNTGSYLDFNNFFNNTADVTNMVKGPNSYALDPQFTNLAQLTGSTATISALVLTQTGANFASVTDNVDYCVIKSGTGATVGSYLITAHTTTTLTFDVTPGTNATADKVWQVTTGRNWKVGTNMKALGIPGTFTGSSTVGFTDLGAVQRQEVVAATTARIGANGLINGIPKVRI
jgi:hypothetical protein